MNLVSRIRGDGSYATILTHTPYTLDLDLDGSYAIISRAGHSERLVHLAPALDEFDDLLSNPCVLRLRVPKLAAPLEEGCNLIFDLDMPLATS